MNLPHFDLERYFARYEFTTRYLLCSSDPEAMPVSDLLAFEEGAAEALGALWLGYTQSRGAPELVRLVAGRYDSVADEGVVVHTGAQEAIFAFMQVAFAPGDHAIVQVPAYQSHYAVLEASGVHVACWQGNGDDLPDPDDLARLAKPSTRAIVITTPNNPTGRAFDRTSLDAIVAFARRRGLLLFCDEVYRGSERDVARQPAACDLYERAVSLGGTAKVHGLAGLRIGWIATRDLELAQSLAAFKDYLSICSSAPSEFLACIALRNEARLFERTRAITTRNLDVLDAFFARRSGTFEWRRPPAGTTAFPRYLGGSSADFCAQLADRAGVLLLPGSVFHATDDRVRFGYARSNLPEAVGALDAFLEKARSGAHAVDDLPHSVAGL